MGGGDGWGEGGVAQGKWRQLYLNNNKKKRILRILGMGRSGFSLGNAVLKVKAFSTELGHSSSFIQKERKKIRTGINSLEMRLAVQKAKWALVSLLP